MNSHYILPNTFNLLIIWKVVLVLCKILILVHQISLWLTSLFERILYNLAFSSVKAVSLHLSIWSSNDLSFFFFFFVKLEILKQLYSDMHALSVLKVGYLVTFLKKSQIMIFQKEKKKKNSTTTLCYSWTWWNGSSIFKKFALKKSMPRESLWQCKIHLCTFPLTKTPIC